MNKMPTTALMVMNEKRRGEVYADREQSSNIFTEFDCKSLFSVSCKNRNAERNSFPICLKILILMQLLIHVQKKMEARESERERKQIYEGVVLKDDDEKKKMHRKGIAISFPHSRMKCKQ